MASSGCPWQEAEEAAFHQTFREVFPSLPSNMQKMPKIPSGKWPLMKEIAKQMHPRLPPSLQHGRSVDATKFRVPFAWNELQEEQMQAALAREQEAVDKMNAAYAKQQDDATKVMELKGKLAEEEKRREEAEERRLEENAANQELLYESAQALWKSGQALGKIMCRLQPTALQQHAADASHPQLAAAHLHLAVDAVPWQPAVINLEMQHSHEVNDDARIGEAWSLPIDRRPKIRRVAVSATVTETIKFGLDDPEI